MNYKDYPLLGDKKNRGLYLCTHKDCEICKDWVFVAVHHHIKQQKAPIELDINYTSLCTNCHGIYHASKKQFVKDIVISPRSRFSGMTNEVLYDYLGKLKTGETVEELYERSI